MSKNPIVPCLWFDDQAEEAAAFYTKTFPRSRIGTIAHYPESVNTPSQKPAGSVLTVDFEVAGQRFTALNGGPVFVKNPSISFFVHVDGPDAANRLYAALKEGGKELMPIDNYPWSERYGWVMDRYGVSWQVIAGRRPEEGATIVPCLMFSDSNRGNARRAMETYARIFKDGKIEAAANYEPGEGPEGLIKHGRFRIAGQEMIAMDSHIAHGFGFNEGISLEVICANQDEIDHYWAALSEGGKPGRCGWLTDSFGISWQIVPAQMTSWMGHEDKAARARTYGAIMRMGKLEIAELERAFQGEETG